MVALNVMEGLSLGLYGILGVSCLVSVLFSLSEADVARYRIQQWFHLFLASFVVVRLLWFALRSAGISESITFVLNRLGFSLYFTAFTLVLFFWVENYHKTYVTSHEFLPRFFWVFVSCNLAMYAYEAIIVILYLAMAKGQEAGNPIYDLSIYTIIALSFAVSITFFVYGLRLYIRHKFAKDYEENNRGLSSELIKIFLCTIMFCICFIIRGCAFLYRPITGGLMNSEVFMTLGYYIPELIPSFVEFYVIRTLKQQSREQEAFIETLYQEEESLQREEGHRSPPLALSNLRSSSSTPSPPTPSSPTTAQPSYVYSDAPVSKPNESSPLITSTTR